MKRAVFLDRDDTINKSIYISDENRIESPLKPEEFELFSTAGDAIKIFNELGFLVIVVTNQPAIAKAKTTVELVDQIHEKMKADLEAQGTQVDEVYYCPHSEPGKGKIPEFTKICDCRKPGQGMFLQAKERFDIDMENSYMIGDSWRDIKVGNSLGCTTFKVDHSMIETHSDLITEQLNNPDHKVKDLYEAALLIKNLEEKK
jgi:D-glycero-D-manno-heptose 1,7-bisphosphate phosphatase|tara:strand:+ start:1122 stop:1727 length:606 start_codon:yes stop_codon:yes gene_type:complete